MTGSGYRPGKSPNVGRYKISKNRIAWANTAITQLVLMRYTEEEMRSVEQVLPGDQYEYGDTFRLMISTTSGRPYTLNLTAMTMEELKIFRELIQIALDLTEPVVLERDRRAAEAYANGDDSYARSYRQAPQFVIREGALSKNSEGVYIGLANVPPGKSGNGDSEGTVRGAGSELADEVPGDSIAQDDSEATD